MKILDENGLLYLWQKIKAVIQKTTGIPTNGIIDYEGDTIPEGYEEVENPNSYSTEEVKTDKTWIDGKPIYRKVVDLGLIGTESADKSYTIGTNIEKLIECKAKLISSTNTSCDLIPVENDGVYAKVNVYSKNGVINIALKRSGIGHYSDRNLVVTVEYTKITD